MSILRMAILALPMALSACATYPHGRGNERLFTGPNGRAAYVITADSATTRLARAERLCSFGYTILSGTDYSDELAIECNAASKEVLDAKVRTLTARRPTEPFRSWHFAKIEPGVTTREEVTEIFGQPTQSMNAGPGGLLDMWIVGSQVVGVVFKDGVFGNLQSIANVDIKFEDKRRLGL